MPVTSRGNLLFHFTPFLLQFLLLELLDKLCLLLYQLPELLILLVPLFVLLLSLPQRVLQLSHCEQQSVTGALPDRTTR